MNAARPEPGAKPSHRFACLSLLAVLLLAAGTAPGRAAPAADCSKTELGRIPLSQPGEWAYLGQGGGLYPGGAMEPPPPQAALAAQAAAVVQPRAADGQPDPDGQMVLLSIGMSNATQEYQRFMALAAAASGLHPRLKLVDGAQGGQTAAVIRDPAANFWQVVQQRLSQAGAAAGQVQAVWLKEANARPTQPFPSHAQALTDDLAAIVVLLKERFPNLQLVYLSSRIYAGYASSNLNPEPYAYESGFSVRWLIERQLSGAPELNADPSRGPVRSPVLLWGPYLWADGLRPRAEDGLTWACADFAEDGTHPADSGRAKVAGLLLNFFRESPSSRPWFLAIEGATPAASATPDRARATRDPRPTTGTPVASATLGTPRATRTVPTRERPSPGPSRTPGAETRTPAIPQPSPTIWWVNNYRLLLPLLLRVQALPLEGGSSPTTAATPPPVAPSETAQPSPTDLPSPTAGAVVAGVDLGQLFAPAAAAELAELRAARAVRPVAAVEADSVVDLPTGDGGRTLVIAHRVGGERHYGALRLPPPVSGEQAPVILVLHGAKDGADLDSLDKMDRDYADLARRSAILIPAFRGEAIKGTPLGDLLSEGDFGTPEDQADDALSLLTAAQELLPQLDGARTVAYGSSRGGGVALAVAARGDPRIRAVFDLFGAADFCAPEVIDAMAEGLRSGRPPASSGESIVFQQAVEPLAAGRLSIAQARRLVLEWSPALFAADMTLPLQAHHGTADRSVPVGHSRRLAAAMAAAGRGEPAFGAFFYEGGGHGQVDGAAERIRPVMAEGLGLR